MSDTLKLNLLKFGMWAASIGLPLAAGFLESWKAAGALGPVMALVVREFDKRVVEPYEAEIEASAPNLDPDTDDGSGDPAREVA